MAGQEDARRKDITTGVLFIAISVIFLILGKNLELGTPKNMGPGFFPLVILLAIAGIGLALIVSAIRTYPVAKAPKRKDRSMWRPLSCILGSVLLFALLVDSFGLAPSLVPTILFATLGRTPWRPVRSVVLAVLITLSTWLIFTVALGMPIPLFAWPKA